MYFKILAKKRHGIVKLNIKYNILCRKDDILSNDKKRRRKLRVNFSGEVVQSSLIECPGEIATPSQVECSNKF